MKGREVDVQNLKPEVKEVYLRRLSLIETRRAPAKGAEVQSSVAAPGEVETCKNSVASAEVSGAATTESKVAAGHDDAYFGVLAGEEVKVPVKQAAAVTEQPAMQPEIVA